MVVHFNVLVCPQSSCVGGSGFNWVWDGIWRCCALHKTVSTKRWFPLFSILLYCPNNCSVFSCTIFSTVPVIAHTSVLFMNIVFLSWLNVSFILPGSDVERSTPSSCFTWKTTNLNCVCAPKMPTDRAALYSRNLQPHTSSLQLHRRLSSFDVKWKVDMFG